MSSSVVIHQVKNDIGCCHEEFYLKHKKLFDKYDYILERHKIPYCLALIKLSKNMASKKVNVKEMIRLSDEHIKVTNEHHLLILTFSNYEQGIAAVHRLERTMIANHDYLCEKPFVFTLQHREKPNLIGPTPLGRGNRTLFKLRETWKTLAEND